MYFEIYEKSDQCEYETNYKGNLSTHMSNQHQIKDASICDECSFTSKIKKGLKWHKERIHGEIVKLADIIFCYQCKYKINEKRNLSFHIIGKHMGAEYSCDKCVFQANGKNSLKRHILSIHNGVM